MTTSVPSGEAKFERRLDARLILSMAAAGSLSFSAVVFETAMNVALPALMSEFSVGTSTIQWITSGYLLVLATVIPVFPWLKARFALRRLFAASVCLFVLGTLACGLAPAFSVLLAGRLLQGVATGVAIPLMFGVVVDQAPYEKMGLMMGCASLVTALAPAVGPSYGGLVMGLAGWRMVFLALVPLVMAALVVGLRSMRQATALSRSPFDAVGFALVALGFSALVFGINAVSEHGPLSASVAVPIAVSAAALRGYFVRSARVRRPLIDVSVFSNRAFSASVAVVALVSFEILGLAYLIPNYAQVALGADALTAGVLLLPGSLASVLLGPLGGRLLDRVGARVPIALGMASFLGCLLLFVALRDALTPPLLMAVYVLFGVGQGLAFSTSMTHGLRCLPEERSADGNSLFNTLQQLGGSLGVSVVTAVVASFQAAGGGAGSESAMRAGGGAAFVVLAAVMVATALLSAASLRLGGRS